MIERFKLLAYIYAVVAVPFIILLAISFGWLAACISSFGCLLLFIFVVLFGGEA